MHGGVSDAELAAHGLRLEDVLDLSANLHPDGPDPAVVEAGRGVRLDRYPHPEALPLRAAIAVAHGLNPATVLPTPGGTAGIHLVAGALLQPGDRATVVAPTFGEYAAAARHAGATVIEVRAAPPTFELDTGALPRAALTFLCAPDNPTGRDLTREDVMRAVDVTGGAVLIDAAYEAFAARAAFASDLARSNANVVAVHSMTKLHAIPGLRLGYIVAAPPLVARLSAGQHAWALDAPSIAAGVVAAAQHEVRRARLAVMRETREWLRAYWEREGLAVAPGVANFLLVRTGAAARVREALFARRIVVRDASSFGLPEWIRIAVPPAAARDEVAAAVVAAAV
ncbi:MAG: aminotransferase class I/II-fold pyridoxal phosphate-dependent enzyme [Dehalococcoidia bacterium]|nr:MAG: aminotransferase class I/II-fold pyridoxal phosphate-dependent enzyme [Dehalococcoidia bacterium]